MGCAKAGRFRARADHGIAHGRRGWVGMSSTTLYVIEKDGTLSEWTEYRNAHGVAPAIWHSLAAKYVPGVRPLGSKDYSGRDYLDREVSRELYRLAKTPGTMADFERRVYCVDVARDKSGRWTLIELNGQPGLSSYDYEGRNDPDGKGGGSKRYFHTLAE